MKYIFLVIVAFNSIVTQGQYDFAIYHDYNVGSWENGIIAFEHFLDWKNLSHQRVTANDVNTTDLKNNYKVIYFPGGDADFYNADINSTGIQNIQDLISNGGAYIGMCAGAEFASDKLVWRGVTYDYQLDLFKGISIGPIDEIAIWPNYNMTTLQMNQTNEINQYETETEDMLYWGGSIFCPYEYTEIDTIATFNDYYDELAIINFTYGNGRVLLISPHPEIEENSARDGVNVAQELLDNGTDWNFLWTATDWLLGKPLTNPTTTTLYNNYSTNMLIDIYPNPAKGELQISNKSRHKIEKIAIFNLFGQIVFLSNTEKNLINVSNIRNGIYFIRIIVNNRKYFEKIIIKN